MRLPARNDLGEHVAGARSGPSWPASGHRPGNFRTYEDLGIDIVAEGLETLDKYEWLRREGIILFQGYLFALPAFRALPAAVFPAF